MEIKFRKYLNINEKALKEVNKIILSGYFKKDFKKKFEILKKLNMTLSNIYKIPVSKIKIVPYYIANKNYDNQYIIIGDALSLVSFLAKFKKKMDFYNKNNDKGEVLLQRDCFDWALSVIQSSTPELIDKIITTKEKIIEKEEEKKEMLNSLIPNTITMDALNSKGLTYSIQSKGGKTRRWKEVF